MMKKTQWLIVIYIFSFLNIYSQDFDNYKPIKAAGKIPSDFTVMSSEAYEEASTQINQKDKKFDRKTQKKFHLVNSFNLHELVYSGKLVYNDILSNYVSKVLDEVLKKNPKLRSQLRVYVVKSPYVNAFATNNGMILINEGLLAQLETEAQLAFILSHEVTHFTKKHVINQYVQNEKIRRGKTEERFKKSNEQLFAINKYSKETEKEADEVGLELYKESQYDYTQVDGVFDVLEYSYLPFDEVAYSKSFLESDKYNFPPKYYPDSLKKLPVDDDDDDSHSTHPSISKRRAYVSKSLNNLKNDGRKGFLVVSKEDFLKIRKVARYELVDEYIQNSSYAEALYCIYLLQKENPNSKYLETSKAKCVYAIAKYKNANQYSSISTDYSDVFGESQTLHHLLKDIPENEFNVYALKYLWDQKNKYRGDTLLAIMCKDLIKDMSLHHYKDLNTFQKEYAKPKDPAADTAVNTAANSKYDKVKKRINTESGDKNYFEYAFVENFKDAKFEPYYKKYSSEAQSESQRKKSEEYKKSHKKYLKKVKRRGYALGIDKVVLANPFYLNVDERKKDQVRYLDSEESAQGFLGMLKDNAQLSGLNLECLDDIDVRSASTDKYNSFVQINDWFSEKSRENKYDVDLVDLNKEETDAFIKKYGTKYVCWMGTLAIREKKHMTTTTLACMMSIYLMPIGIARIATPEYNTYFYTLVYDIEKRELVAVRSEIIDRNDSKTQMNSIIYDTFYQIKRKK